MKKSYVITAFLTSLLGVSFLGIEVVNHTTGIHVNAKSEKVAKVKKNKEEKYSKILRKAQKDGAKQGTVLAKTPKSSYVSEASYVMGRKSFEDMDKKTAATIQGVVTNWTSVPEAKNTAVTILSVYVKEGLTPKSKKLAGKTIYIYQQGGYNKRKNFLDGMTDKQGMDQLSEQELNETIFYEKQGLPVPKIGTEIVASITKVGNLSTPKESQLVDLKRSYSLAWSEQGLWIKSPTSSKYETASDFAAQENGNKVSTLGADNSVSAKIDEQITDKINEITK